MLCYFQHAELDCPGDVDLATQNFVYDSTQHHLSEPNGNVGRHCSQSTTGSAKRTLRMAGIEYLFTRVTPLLQKEAQRQLELVFPSGVVPKDLITVHIRWGDKDREMKRRVPTQHKWGTIPA